MVSVLITQGTPAPSVSVRHLGRDDAAIGRPVAPFPSRGCEERFALVRRPLGCAVLAARPGGDDIKQVSDDSGLRITQQFRSRDAMVYDLRGAAGRLTLRITGRGDDDGVEWRVEASTSTSPDAISVASSAPTRAKALHAVGQTWTATHIAQNLPLFDWEAVAKALADVRAL